MFQKPRGPDDTGLIGERQATIEIPAWPDAKGADLVLRHTFGPVDGFRLSGLRLVAPPRNRGTGTAGIRLWARRAGGGGVVEDCYFGWTVPRDVNGSPGTP